LFEQQFAAQLIAKQYSQLYAAMLHARDAAVLTVASCLSKPGRHTSSFG
jgi:hypothetical protein